MGWIIDSRNMNLIDLDHPLAPHPSAPQRPQRLQFLHPFKKGPRSVCQALRDGCFNLQEQDVCDAKEHHDGRRSDRGRAAGGLWRQEAGTCRSGVGACRRQCARRTCTGPGPGERAGQERVWQDLRHVPCRWRGRGPQAGDKADWGPRIAQGKDTLYKHAIDGFTGAKGMMPAKGGASNLSDAEVKAAVDYMADKSL